MTSFSFLVAQYERRKTTKLIAKHYLIFLIEIGRFISLTEGEHNLQPCVIGCAAVHIFLKSNLEVKSSKKITTVIWT